MRSLCFGLGLIALLSACSGNGESTSIDAHPPALRTLDVDPTLPTLADPAWTPAAPMPRQRGQQAMVLLPSGKVLVIGGATAKVDIYDRATDTWAPAASMNVERSGHTATLLPSGEVLVIGGSTGPTFTAEIYDPALDIWKLTAPMNIHRVFHTATLLPSGQVLVAGGSDLSASAPAYALMAELYDPATDAWTLAAPLAHGRREPAATLLPNGMVLIADGAVDPTPVGSCELYDPATNTFLPTGALLTAHVNPAATLLPDGKVLVTGGTGNWPALDAIPASKVAELYDPTTGTWTLAPPLLDSRYGHTSTLLLDGRVLIAGGASYDGPDAQPVGRLELSEIYDPATNTWVSGGSMGILRYGPSATRLANGEVLVLGGWAIDPFTQQGGSTTTTEVFRAVVDGGTTSSTTGSSGGTGGGHGAGASTSGGDGESLIGRGCSQGGSGAGNAAWLGLGLLLLLRPRRRQD